MDGIRCCTYGNPVKRLFEGVGHTTANDERVDLTYRTDKYTMTQGTINWTHLVQHVIDELNLVGNLGATEDSQERSLGALKRLREEVELFLDEETGSTLRKLNANHRRVCTMSRAERVVHVYVAEVGEPLTELSDLGGVGLGLVALFVLYGALLFDVETEVFEEDDGAVFGRSNGLLDVGADAVVEEDDRLADEFREFVGDGFKRVFGVDFAVRTSEMGHQDDLGSAWSTMSETEKYCGLLSTHRFRGHT